MAKFYYQNKSQGSALTIGPFDSEDDAESAAEKAGICKPNIKILREDGNKFVPVATVQQAIDAVREATELTRKLKGE